jgi:AcrR family transcriptional regulator
VSRLSRREREKLAKLGRISTAARSVFAERGFEHATIKEIAERADVGVGTIFLYAPDKGSLLLMLVTADLADAGVEPARRFGPGAPLVDRLLAYFRPRYEYWANDPRLARAAVRELGSRSPDDPLARARYERMHADLCALIGQPNRADRATVARLIEDIYHAETQRWVLSERLDVDEGIRQLATMFALAGAGFGS